MRKQTWLFIGGALLAGAAAFIAFKPSRNKPLETVPFVDLKQYMGTWYEIASFPQRFQKGCHCTKAEYSLNAEGYVEVKNTCRKNSPTGDLKGITGKAFVVDKETNAKLKVQFFRPFKGDYWILELAPNYSYAVVGTPDRKYLWILSRGPKMNQEVYNNLVTRMQQKGFDISKLQITDQVCN